MAVSYFDTPFDLAIAGINWGANLGSAIPSSGTLGAAQRCLAVELTQKAIAFSWDLPLLYYTMQHNGTDAIEEFMHYPGSAIVSILEHALTNDFWQSDLLNINFPPEIATEVRMTKLLPQLKEIYDYESNKTDNTKLGGQFKYTGGRTAKSNRSLAFDVAAVDAGYISITPCKFDYLDESTYERARNVAFPL